MRIRARCPECGGVVSYDEGQSLVTCPHCGEYNVVEDLLSMRQYMQSADAERIRTEQYGRAIKAIEDLASRHRTVDQGAAQRRGGRNDDEEAGIYVLLGTVVGVLLGQLLHDHDLAIAFYCLIMFCICIVLEKRRQDRAS